MKTFISNDPPLSHMSCHGYSHLPEMYLHTCNQSAHHPCSIWTPVLHWLSVRSLCQPCVSRTSRPPWITYSRPCFHDNSLHYCQFLYIVIVRVVASYNAERQADCQIKWSTRRKSLLGAGTGCHVEAELWAALWCSSSPHVLRRS